MFTEEAHMYCVICGDKIPESASFCVGCGSPVNRANWDVGQTDVPAQPAPAPPPPPPPISTPHVSPPAASSPTAKCNWCGATVDAAQSSCPRCGATLTLKGVVDRSGWGQLPA